MEDPAAARMQWDTRHAAEPERFSEPDGFLLSAYREFIQPAYPKGGAVLDVGGGPGRHALFMAQQGWTASLVDISPVAIEEAGRRAAAQHLTLDTFVADVNDFDFGRARFDLITVFFFLQRELFPSLFAALKPGGLLVYKTYTIEQIKLASGPVNPQHLLTPNELLWAFGQMRILHYRELIGERATAELVARRMPEPEMPKPIQPELE